MKYKQICCSAALLIVATVTRVVSAATHDIGTESHVVFELCRPGHLISEDIALAYQGVTNDGYGEVTVSATKFFSSNEPVYYHYAGSPSRIRAIIASFADEKEVHFVYLVPTEKALKVETWTVWFKPSAITNDERIEAKLLRGLPYTKVDHNASNPMVRYKLMHFSDYLNTVTRRSAPPVLIEGGSCPSE